MRSVIVDYGFGPFKIINDTYGHAAGDEIIREIGSIIMASFRKAILPGASVEKNLRGLKNAFGRSEKIAEKFRETVVGRKVMYGGRKLLYDKYWRGGNRWKHH